MGKISEIFLRKFTASIPDFIRILLSFPFMLVPATHTVDRNFSRCKVLQDTQIQKETPISFLLSFGFKRKHFKRQHFLNKNCILLNDMAINLI